MIKRPITRMVAAMLATSLSLSACAPTEKQKTQAYLPKVIPTAYMLFYDKNSATAAQGEPLLLEVSAALLTSQSLKATINAYRSPDEATNQDSLRAQQVMTFLVGHGVDPSRTLAAAMGVAEAIGKDDDGAARRRVEIILSPVTAAPK